jgi:hypothetical protein
LELWVLQVEVAMGTALPAPRATSLPSGLLWLCDHVSWGVRAVLVCFYYPVPPLTQILALSEGPTLDDKLITYCSHLDSSKPGSIDSLGTGPPSGKESEPFSGGWGSDCLLFGKCQEAGWPSSGLGLGLSGCPMIGTLGHDIDAGQGGGGQGCLGQIWNTASAKNSLEDGYGGTNL